MSTGHPLTDEQIMYIRKNFANTRNQDLADHLGVSKSAVCNIAHRFCLHKSKEHDHNMGSKAGKAAWASGNIFIIKITPEIIEKKVTTYKNIIRQERARVAFGLPQKTKIKVKRQPRKKCDHRFYLKSRGYILDEKNFIAYWTNETKRSLRLEAKPKRYYTFKQLQTDEL